jgi:putative transposase
MQRAVKVRLYPSPEQEALLSRTAGACRFVCNQGLGLKKNAWEQDQLNISSYDLMAMIPMWKEEFPWLGEVSSVALQQSLRNLDRAYSNFFKACKGESKAKARFPRFKTRNSRASFRLVGAAFSIKDGQLYVAKSRTPLAHRDKQPLPTDASSVTISRDAAGRWFASLLTDDVVAIPETTGERAVGVDLGIKTFAVTSDGDEFANPHHFDKHRARLKKYQRVMARRAPKPGQKASNNYRKTQRKVARVHGKIADGRRNTINQVTTELVRRYDVICIEDLNVAGMIKNRKLARSIADVSWGEFRRQLEYKTEWYGKRLVVIDRFSPS